MGIRFIISGVMAYYVGRAITKFKLPAILGWLITGMIIGPHALNILNIEVLSQGWYQTLISFFESGVGILIGSELVMSELRKTGKQILVTTLFQSIGTFIVVSFTFGLLFYLLNIPIYVAILLGAIALATAPAPALSITQEFQTDGPVTHTLIPMAVLDDVVAIIIFFSINTILKAKYTTQDTSLLLSLFEMIVLPLLIGGIIGIIGSKFLKKPKSNLKSNMIILLFLAFLTLIGIVLDLYVFEDKIINFLLMGMAFSASFSNLIHPSRNEVILRGFDPILALFLLFMIMNLGAPLDYHLILGAGMFTFVYMASRAFGKIYGAKLGAKVSRLPETVQKYLGFTLLPHSGVSLVFTGIAVATLSAFDQDAALVIQGIVTAAAVINEIIAVILSKKAFEWADELNRA